MDVYWLEQAEADVPPENDWLNPGEIGRLNGMRFAKRKADWRLGRWTAKHAVAAYLDMPCGSLELAKIEITPAPSGAPEVQVANQFAPVAISLTHRGGVAACVIGPPTAQLGCDVEVIEPRSQVFVADYFTVEEQRLIAQASAEEHSRLVALLWSGKESALKTLRTGLRQDTRSVMVKPVLTLRCGEEEDVWRPLHIRHERDRVLWGWWQSTGSLLRTTVAIPRATPPVFLQVSESRPRRTGYPAVTYGTDLP